MLDSQSRQNELARHEQVSGDLGCRRKGTVWSPGRHSVRISSTIRPKAGDVDGIRYNIEHVTAFVRAAENRQSPFIIQLFPSSLIKTPALVHAAAAAAKSASAPISVHLDHAQSREQIRFVAESLPLDSIMVDMSHDEKLDNLANTTTLREYCRDRRVAVEAETGRIEGGEDGIMDTGDLGGILTDLDDVEGFLSAGVDMLAPSVGNIHGDYGPEGPQLDLDR